MILALSAGAQTAVGADLPAPPVRARPSLEIGNGTPETGFPAVVTLGLPPLSVCSGTLSTPRLVRTAAHCSGDSGGPQLLRRPDGSFEQIAVHSWADSGCTSVSGSTRTDVAADWILDQVERIHGTRDLCEASGRYHDGVCDTCVGIDPDCLGEPTASLVRGEAADECVTTGQVIAPWIWLGRRRASQPPEPAHTRRLRDVDPSPLEERVTTLSKSCTSLSAYVTKCSPTLVRTQRGVKMNEHTLGVRDGKTDGRTGVRAGAGDPRC